jgi:hypothetical protein
MWSDYCLGGRIPRVRVWIKLKNSIVFLLRLALVILTIPNRELPCMHHFSWELWGSKRSVGREDGVRRGGICLFREFDVCVCWCAGVSLCVQFSSPEINIFLSYIHTTLH